MAFISELFASIFDNDTYREVIHNSSTYGGKVNDAMYARGDRAVQAYQELPWIAEVFGYTEFEKNYDPEPILNWMKQNNYMIPIFAVILYYMFIFHWGPSWIKSREKAGKKPFNLNGPLAVWNLSLSLFSWWGASRTVPHLLWRIKTQPFMDTVCLSPHFAFGSGACGLATQMFILSKLPELIDTVFLVVKGKPVIFLHWYHHITVLLYCWNSYVTEGGAGLYFVAMNYCVHAMMYFYFFLMAVKQVPVWYNPFPLTICQISQMVVGTSVVSACIYYHYYGTKIYHYATGDKPCHNLQSNLIAGGLMYASYLYLFCEFAFKRFFYGTNDYEKKPKSETKKSK